MHQIPDKKSWDIQTKLQKNYLIKLYQISIQMKSIEKLIILEKLKNFNCSCSSGLIVPLGCVRVWILIPKYKKK